MGENERRVRSMSECRRLGHQGAHHLLVDEITALRAALAESEAARAVPRHDMSSKRKYQTLCPEHGWGVKVDEDGCCGGCGSPAFGPGVDEAAGEIFDLEAARAADREVLERADTMADRVDLDWHDGLLEAKRAYRRAREGREKG